MSFRLRCTCGRILTIQENLAGHKGKCPGCNRRFLIPQIPAYLRPTEKRNPFEPDHPIPPIPVVPLPNPVATPTGPGRYETDEGVQFEEVTELPIEQPASMGGPPEDQDLVATPEPFPVPPQVASSPGAAGSAGVTPRSGVRPSQGPVPALKKQPEKRPSSSGMRAAAAPAPPAAPGRRAIPVWILVVGAIACIGIGAVVMWLLGR